MPLILAIEPDAQQAALLAALAPRHVDAEILLAPTVDRALEVLAIRVPDLLLTPTLLSTRDDAALTTRVRELDEQGIAVPILVIPVLAADQPVSETAERPGGLFTRIRRSKPAPSAPAKGCRPEVFAGQIAEYLRRAAAERHDREEAERSVWSEPPPTATAPLLAELLPPPVAAPVVDFEEMAEPEPFTEPVELPEENHPIVVVGSASAPGEDAGHAHAAIREPEKAEAADESTDEFEELFADAPGDAADELWTPLPLLAAHAMPPLEGPSLKTSAPTPLAKTPKAERGRKPTPAPSPTRTKRARTSAKPMQDEWGLYDPEQCGFAALLERLEQLAQAPQTDEAAEGGSVIMGQ